MKGQGFGSLLLNRAVPMQLRGQAHAEAGEGFYRYELTAPLSELRSRAYAAAPAVVARTYV